MGEVHTAELRINVGDITTDPGYDKLFDFQKEGAKTAERLLTSAINTGSLVKSDFKNVIDFGAGYGGPTFTLSKIAKEFGGSVTAVEKGPLSTKVLQSGVIPDISVVVDDGISYLDAIREDNKPSLITAFMFGPDRTAVFF